MQIDPNIGANATPPPQPAGSGGAQVDKLQFLKLLTTQLQYQDPLNPMDNTEFTAQLAQFSSLEQLTHLNDGMERLLAAESGIGRLQALGYLGHTVEAPVDRVTLPEQGDARFQVRLEQAADDVVVTLRDGSGNAVATDHLGPLGAGVQPAAWDGLDANGTRLPAGEYRIEVGAVDGDGNPVSATPLGPIRVTGVDLSGAEPALLTGAGRVALSEVAELRE
ncbi:MAG: flagellar hook assembly protein FlgD [Nitrospirae bacterium]|nr:MAG: flagellar hook assembly protein FlgD [Nitrospirota bacterium]